MILEGTTQDGRRVPVQVDAQGRLVAQGLDGATGPQGPAGPAGPAGADGTPGPVLLRGNQSGSQFISGRLPSPAVWLRINLGASTLVAIPKLSFLVDTAVQTPTSLNYRGISWSLTAAHVSSTTEIPLSVGTPSVWSSSIEIWKPTADWWQFSVHSSASGEVLQAAGSFRMASWDRVAIGSTGASNSWNYSLQYVLA